MSIPLTLILLPEPWKAIWHCEKQILLPVIDQSLMLECNGSSFFRWYLLVPGLQKHAVSFISLSVAPWLKQRHWSSFMITLYNVFVVQVKGVQGGLRVCNTSWGNSLLCTLQPVLHTLSLYCTPSASTAHLSLYCTYYILGDNYCIYCYAKPRHFKYAE